jgi:redox-sensitive bicupin YhaK (pirin superfamily)
MAGFPWHPHRGIETVTYILKGDVEHKDSIGNAGVIGKGDVQWMKSGSGIIHQEMPRGGGGLIGFQLWINIPKKHKMTAPNYQEYSSKEIPEFEYTPGVIARVVAGPAETYRGPVTGDDVDPTYIDFDLKPGAELAIPVPSGYTSFIYIFEGSIQIDESQYKSGKVILFDRKGTQIYLGAKSSGARILFVSGKPLHEPVAWHGPIVMNTRAELAIAFDELNNGTFIK